MAPLTNREYSMPQYILRILMMCGRTVAFSCCNIWIVTKAMDNMPASTKRAIIRPSFHGYCVPPHSNARRKQTMPGRKTRVPKGSSRAIFCRIDIGFWTAEGCSIKVTIAKLIAPKGRLRVYGVSRCYSDLIILIMITVERKNRSGAYLI